MPQKDHQDAGWAAPHLLSGMTVVNSPSELASRAGGIGFTSIALTIAGKSFTAGTRCSNRRHLGVRTSNQADNRQLVARSSTTILAYSRFVLLADLLKQQPAFTQCGVRTDQTLHAARRQPCCTGAQLPLQVSDSP